MTRMRSPSYPSVSLSQAIDLVGQIHKSNRTNVIDRESAARDMGYTGLTGRSLKVLAALLQFGLLSKAGKGEVKVTQTAVDILHGIESDDRSAALLKAGRSPALFQELHDRFPHGPPSENAIRSYLIQQGFADVAIGPAITAYLDTYHHLQNILESESHGGDESQAPQSGPVETKPDVQAMDAQAQQAPTYIGRQPPHFYGGEGMPISKRDLRHNEVYLDIRGSREVHIEGVLDYDGILDLEEKLKALKMLIKKLPRTQGAADNDEADDSDE